MATANTALLLRDFLSRGGSTFYIPAFQRSYSWDEKQCEELWNDIIKIADYRKKDNQRTHFMSDIVLKQSGNWKFLLIDGQQRITTILLLILAMRDIFDKQELYDDYINNKNDKELRIKLKSVADDHENLMEIVDGKDISKNDSQIVENYVFFKDKIEEEDISYDYLLEGLRGLEVIVVTLGNDDNANLVFEKINSAGKKLETSDLIRNYLLMQNHDLDDQDELYKTHWQKIENNFSKDKKNQIDVFFANYLIVKTKEARIKNKDDLYNEFKNYFEIKWKKPVAELLDDILLYSGYFKEIINIKVDNKELSMALRFFNNIGLTVFYPLLLQTWDLWKKEKLTTGDLTKIIWAIEAFTLALIVSKNTSSNTNKRIPNIMESIETDGKEHNCSDIVIFYMQRELQEFKDVLIKDEDFRNRTKSRSYDILQSRMSLMRRLEYHLQDEKERTINVFDDKFQLEHILPQKIKSGSQWEKDFGENGGDEHKKYLGKLGNLTLTGRNPELSNKDFLEKKSLYEKSNMELNRFVKGCDVWTDEQINDRTDYLSKEIVTMITKALPSSDYKPSKQTNDDLENQYNLTKIKDKLDNDRKYFNGKKPAVIKIMEKEYGVDSWKDMLVRFLKILYEKKPDDFKKFVKEYKKDRDNMFFYEDEEKVIAGSSTKDKIDARKIADSNIWIKTVLATNQILPMIIEASDVLKLKEDDITIALRDDDDDEE